MDTNRLARSNRRRDDRLVREIERNAENVGIFDIEQLRLVEIVGLAPKTTTDDLLTKELRAEGAHTENMRDGVGVPTLGQHRNRDDAADRFAELPRLADRVHDFAQQLLVGDVLTGPDVARARDDLAAEPFNLVPRHITKIFVERLPRFELLTVDQQRPWAR